MLENIRTIDTLCKASHLTKKKRSNTWQQEFSTLMFFQLLGIYRQFQILICSSPIVIMKRAVDKVVDCQKRLKHSCCVKQG